MKTPEQEMKTHFTVVEDRPGMPQLWIEYGDESHMLYMVGVPAENQQFMAQMITEAVGKFYELGKEHGAHSLQSKLKDLLNIEPA